MRTSPLLPIYEAYRTLKGGQDVVRQCLALDTTKAFQNTRFDALPVAEIRQQLDAAKDEIADLAILSLYAAFEATIVAN